MARRYIDRRGLGRTSKQELSVGETNKKTKEIIDQRLAADVTRLSSVRTFNRILTNARYTRTESPPRTSMPSSSAAGYPVGASAPAAGQRFYRSASTNERIRLESSPNLPQFAGHIAGRNRKQKTKHENHQIHRPDRAACRRGLSHDCRLQTHEHMHGSKLRFCRIVTR